MIIDFHTHVYPSWLSEQRDRWLEQDATFAELFGGREARLATADELVQAMDEDGVDMAVIMGIGWTDHGLARESNDYIVESVSLYPDRLKGFAGVSPAWGELAVSEAERCARAGLSGIGELRPDSQGFDLGDRDAMTPLVEVARAHGLVLTTHASEPVGHLYQGKGHTRPEVLWRFIQNFPDVVLVCAHWGGGLPFYALMPEVRQALANVYFDTAASPFLYDAQVLPVVTSLVGADRVLLGSDFPLVRSGRLLSQLRESPLADEEKDAIAGGNAARLLGV